MIGLSQSEFVLQDWGSITSDHRVIEDSKKNQGFVCRRDVEENAYLV